MSPTAKRVLTATLVFSLGFVFGVTALYIFYRPVIQMFAWAPYTRAASMGTLYVKTLGDIRAGSTDKAIERLEIVLDSEIITLSSYEEVVPASKRDSHVYKAAALMRDYRQQVPSPSEDSGVRELVKRGLSLGSPAKPRASDGP